MTDSTIDKTVEYDEPAPAYDTAPPRLLAGRSKRDPVRVIPHAERDENVERERVPVFAVDHEDGSQTVYDMPADPQPHLMLRFLRQMRTIGDAAIVDLLVATIGDEALDALEAELAAMPGDVADATMQSVVQRVQQNVGGGIKR